MAVFIQSAFQGLRLLSFHPICNKLGIRVLEQYFYIQEQRQT